MYSGKDIHGREYLRISDAKPGMKIHLDDDFTCTPDKVQEIKSDGDVLYFECSADGGRHNLLGQVEYMTDGTPFYMGVYPA